MSRAVVLLLAAGAWMAPRHADAASYVKSVEYVEIVLGAAQTSNVANLSKSQVVANSVPFASAMASSAADAFGKIFADVFLTAGSPPTVTVQRGLAGGIVTVGVYVVEFDPTYVKVQQGVFGLTGAQAGPINAGIPQPVSDLTRAAMVFYHRNDVPVGGQGYDNTTIEGWFSATSQLRFQREGSGNAVNGHWYVFEALNVAGFYAFVVQTKTFSFATTIGTATLTPSVPSELSFVVGSYRAAETQDHPDKGSYQLYLVGCAGSPVVCTDVLSRSNATPDDGPTSVTAFVITFSSGVRVQRGLLSYGGASTQQTATLNPSVSTSSTIAWNALGMGPGSMRANEGSGDLMFEAHQRLTLASSTTVQGDRGASGASAVGTWEAVEWQVTTNYRSIGTASDVSGTLSATQGSVVVTDASATWVTANRGRGDRIGIGGTDYTVLAVESQTQLRLTTAFAATSGSYAYTISRQFPTLALWVDCIDGPAGTPCTYFPVASASLVADDRSEVGIAYDDSPFTGGVLIDGSTTDATHTITLTADGTNRHYGLPGQGARLDNSAGITDPIQIRDDHVTVEWLEVFGGADPSVDGVHLQSLTNGANRIVLRNLLIHDVPQYGINDNSADVVVDIYNNVIYNSGRGIRINSVLAANASVRILNNTVYNSSSVGAVSSAGGASLILLRNNVVHTGPANVIAVANLDGNSSNNLASDASGTAHSPAGGGQDGVSLAAVSFVNAGAGNLHINPASVAADAAFDLSSVFTFDVDAGARVAPWDIGADDVDATTAVELSSFNAAGRDGAVDLDWETASELRNLGFHLYRAHSATGPYERITASAIPGLGSSPHGARYRYLDTGLENGRTYFYRLEDIETTGRTEMHGPVSATPSPEAGPPAAASSSLVAFGDPGARAQVLRRDAHGLVLELVTEGFFAEPREDGTVVFRVPGLEPLDDPGPALPVERTWIEAIAGRKVELASVSARDVMSFASLRPSDAASLEIAATRGGALRAARGRARGLPESRDVYPSWHARLLSVGFQGEVKKALVEMAPLRWDPATGQLLLARRLVVRVSFREPEPSERSTDGTRGRRRQASRERSVQRVLVRLATTDAGLYAMPFEELPNRPGRTIDASGLRLSRQGEVVAYHLEPRPDRFGKGSTLYFVSEGAAANPYGNEAVYELELASGGERMEEADASPSGEALPYHWTRLRREENRYYQAALLDAPDAWLWEVLLAPARKSFPFAVDALASTTESPRLSVWLQGTSDLPVPIDHHVLLAVNGTLVEERSWDGKNAQRVDLLLPPGLLRNGENALEIENVGDTEAAYSMVMLDRFEVSYARFNVAVEGRIEGTWRAPGSAEISGLGSGALLVDVTDARPRWLLGARAEEDGLVRARAENGRRFLGVARDALLRPEPRKPRAPILASGSRGADYLLIAPEELLREAAPLLELRKSQGLRVAAIAMESIESELGFGESTPEALRTFLTHAYHEWRSPSPRYVVLLGDATYDFKDYLGTGTLNRVPPRIVATSYLLTASDPSYAAVNGDDELPDLAIGRLPAANAAEARAMVEKIVAWEQGGFDLDSAPVVLVADDSDAAGDFVADADAIAASVLRGRGVRKIYLSELGVDATRSSIVRAFDDGASVLSYLGHGGIHLWASENVFDLTSSSSLSPGAQQPLLLTMNCLNGYFHFPYFNSLAEELLKAPGRGAIAAFSPSGLSVNAAAQRFHVALLEEVFSGRHPRLGDAVLKAQEIYLASGALPELLAIYHLLGDPALTLAGAPAR